MTRKTLRNLSVGLAFLAPNVAGFLVFTLVPLLVSFAMAFTNWDIRLHNLFSNESVRFVGLANFRRLLSEPEFLQYFGNTLFFMLTIPFAMAGSLGAALLLSRELRGRSRRQWAWLLCTAGLLGGTVLLTAIGCGATAMVVLMAGLAATLLTGGSAGGTAVYRTVFFSPHFTAGVATFLLWKKMYNPTTGAINAVLAPLLDRLEVAVKAVPPPRVQAVAEGAALLLVWLLGRSALRLWRAWRDGEAGTVSVLLSMGLLAIPAALAPAWAPTWRCGSVIAAAGVLAGGWLALRMARGRNYTCPPDYGLSAAVIPSGVIMALGLALLGLGSAGARLPAMCQKGLLPPEWLAQYDWAKPALMLMGLWAAIGSNNMLLYLAGLSNISPELYEAAEIDGASARQRFWQITWPQLAPVTFFIFVMSVIGGLQGGFEMARVMTNGGPAGATTTLSYFVYTEGFSAGRLGYASAAAWALFLLVFLVTLFNWKFGNRQAGE